MSELNNLLITGAAGDIGQALRPGLRLHYRLRLCDLVDIDGLEEGEESLIADIRDLSAMEEAASGMDAIVHLAGFREGTTPWPACYETNMGGTYHVLEAARRQGVRRVVFASTNHVTGFYDREGVYTRPDMPARPDSLYGVSKAFGEDLSRFYADEFGLSVICLRIGTFRPELDVRQRSDDRILSTWLSPRDAVQLVTRSLETSVVFGIYYGISGNTRAVWDLQNARRELGYHPEDDAELVARTHEVDKNRQN
ncbi:MAG: NAD(P)-dependent oxidoreductase [Candidatus Latescibacterota bacterium]|nr:NAD(P)-dependent oxidoreductase [Candidatus Latescibacterota bacterium]